MGYVYVGKRLMCDVCGEADGTVSKRPCPYGYCQPTAMCKSCWNTGETREQWKQYHEDVDCKGASESWQAKKDLTAKLMSEGKFVRKAAINVGDGKVKVTFHGESEPYVKEVIMPSETYASIPIMQPATMEDYGY